MQGSIRTSADRESFSVEEATRLFPPRNGRHPCVRTLWRWMQQGRRGVRLEYEVQGGRRMICRAAVEAFRTALNEHAGCPTHHVRQQTSLAAARIRLRKIGVI